VYLSRHRQTDRQTDRTNFFCCTLCAVCGEDEVSAGIAGIRSTTPISRTASRIYILYRKQGRGCVSTTICSFVGWTLAPLV